MLFARVAMCQVGDAEQKVDNREGKSSLGRFQVERVVAT